MIPLLQLTSYLSASRAPLTSPSPSPYTASTRTVLDMRGLRGPEYIGHLITYVGVMCGWRTDNTHLYHNSHCQSSGRHSTLQAMTHHTLREAGAPAPLDGCTHLVQTTLVQVCLKLTCSAHGQFSWVGMNTK